MTWIEDKVRLTEKFFSLINKNNTELYAILKEKRNEAEYILPLADFIIERLATATELAKQDRLWDAEIILRSALETLVKFVFITAAPDKEEQDNRIKEFWFDLAEVNSVKQSEQAKNNLIHLGNSETHKLAYSPNVLDEQDEQTIRAKRNHTERQRLEQKWSFTEIVKSLSQNYRGKPMEMIVILSHSYRMASHVAHGDQMGILISQERNSRSREEQDQVNFAHYLRILTDGLTYCSFVAIETMHFLKLDPSFFFKNQSLINDEIELIDKYHRAVFSDSYYDKYRTSEPPPPEPEKPFDFGGLPQRDLKKNLGC